MFKIAICDSDEVFVKNLKLRIETYLEPYVEEKQVTILVKTFNNAIQMLDALTQQFQIFFLDIKMPEIDGKKMAFYIKKRDKNAYIIFMSWKKKYVFEAFELGVCAYLMKPVSDKILKKELNRAFYTIWRQKREAIVVKNKMGYYKIYLSDIQYIETEGIYTKLHTENGLIESRRRMKEYENLLEEKSFVRCHNSYIVNLDYIRTIEKSRIILETGEILFISKARKRVTRERFLEYIGNLV